MAGGGSPKNRSQVPEFILFVCVFMLFQLWQAVKAFTVNYANYKKRRRTNRFRGDKCARTMSPGDYHFGRPKRKIIKWCWQEIKALWHSMTLTFNFKPYRVICYCEGVCVCLHCVINWTHKNHFRHYLWVSRESCQ